MFNVLSVVFLCSIPNAVSDLLARRTYVFFDLCAGILGLLISRDPASKVIFVLAILSAIFLPEVIRIGKEEIGGGDIDQLLLIAGAGVGNMISVLVTAAAVAAAYVALSGKDRRKAVSEIPYAACLCAGSAVVISLAVFTAGRT